LVLGANGFIGSHLVDALVAHQQSVRAFDRFGHDPVFTPADKIEIMRGDFLNEGDLARALQDVDYVFHFVSLTTPMTAEDDPLIDIETNVRMSVKLFQLCVDAKVKRIIFASTGGAIYGGDGHKPCAETDLPQPVSPYAIGKLTIEHYLRYFKRKQDLDSIVLRISNPYGERQPLHRKQGVIPIFLENIYTDRPLTILGDGSMVRDYVYVKDVASMLADTFDRPHNYEVYNVGSGSGCTVGELVKAVETVSGRAAKVSYKPAPATFVQRVVLDTSRFTDEFKLQASTGLDEGLAATYRYVKREIDRSDQS
jgi:UDP-glucose 4-epimerase